MTLKSVLGMDSTGVNKLLDYQNVAIEIEEFKKSDIDKLKENNISIYAYLSVGSLENYRPYYDEFKQYTFQEYENWEDEKWIDVSISSWQEKLNELATSFKNLGADGLFLDNFDVYYYALEISEEFGEKNYQGCHQILENLSKTGLKLLINSGTDFLERLDKENDPLINEIDWYAQECVFSNIKNYQRNIFTRQNKEDVEAQLKAEAEKGLQNYLLLQAIGEKENIILSDEEFDFELAKMADQYNMSIDDIKKALGQNIAQFRHNITMNKIETYLFENNQ